MEEGAVTQGMAWPANLQRQEDGSILVGFPDIPETLMEGTTEAEAQARDCLIAALGGYVAARRAIPRASPAPRRAMIALPALAGAKVALHGEMRSQGAGNTALAARLSLTEGAAPRLIDPAHRSHIGQVETALLALGQRLTIATRAA